MSKYKIGDIFKCNCGCGGQITITHVQNANYGTEISGGANLITEYYLFPEVDLDKLQRDEVSLRRKILSHYENI